MFSPTKDTEKSQTQRQSNCDGNENSKGKSQHLLKLTVAGTPSSCRAPWFDTKIPFKPCLTASRASSPGKSKTAIVWKRQLNRRLGFRRWKIPVKGSLTSHIYTLLRTFRIEIHQRLRSRIVATVSLAKMLALLTIESWHKIFSRQQIDMQLKCICSHKGVLLLSVFIIINKIIPFSL